MKFFFGLLAFLAAVIVVVLLVVGLFKSFNGNDNGNLISTSTYSLSDKTAVDTVARYTVRGPVVADEDYRQVRITISKNSRSVEVLKGYAGVVEKVSTLSNTPDAYTAFLGALSAAEFSDRREGGSSVDPSTTCVTSTKFFYELTLASEKKVDTWTSSCSFKDGNYGGNALGTAQIFKAQIPTYDQLTNGVNLPSL